MDIEKVDLNLSEFNGVTEQAVAKFLALDLPEKKNLFRNQDPSSSNTSILIQLGQKVKERAVEEEVRTIETLSFMLADAAFSVGSLAEDDLAIIIQNGLESRHEIMRTAYINFAESVERFGMLRGENLAAVIIKGLENDVDGVQYTSVGLVADSLRKGTLADDEIGVIIERGRNSDNPVLHQLLDDLEEVFNSPTRSRVVATIDKVEEVDELDEVEEVGGLKLVLH